MKKEPLTHIQKQQMKKQNQRGNRKPQPQPKSNIQPQPQTQQQTPTKLSYKDVVMKSLKNAENNNKAENKQTSPDVITQSAEIEAFIAQEEIPFAFDEETADVKETVLEELKASFIAKSTIIHGDNEYHPIHTNPVDLTIVPEAADLINSCSNNAPVITEEFPFFSLKTTQEIQNNNDTNNVPSELLQSVLLPTEKKGLGFFGNLSYYTTNPITAIIARLQEKTYVATDKDNFGWLTIALQKAIADNNLDALTTISALCAENYNTIRYADEEAQKSLNLYTSSISLAEKEIEDKYTEIAQKYNSKTAAFAQFLLNTTKNYEQEIQALNTEYEAIKNKNNELIESRKKQIGTLSILNKSIRPQILDLVAQPNNIRSTNECAEKLEVAKLSLNLVEKISGKMPLIMEPKLALIQNQLENK